MNEELENKIVIITGGGQGIGRNMAITFGRQGAHVIICSRTEHHLREVRNEIQKTGGSCDFRVVDVSISLQVKDFIESVMSTHGRIDILITCAGIYGPIGSFEDTDVDQWNETISINLMGTVNVVRHVVPFMKQRREGKIITMCGAGIGGPNITPNFSAYTTSKAAIAGFTEALSRELMECNIQVNAISPGAVNTRLLDIALAAKDNAGADFLEKCKDQKRNGGTPIEKSAELATFLASRESNYITGKVISAVWDDTSAFPMIKDDLEHASRLNLRRIDGFMYLERNNSSGGS